MATEKIQLTGTTETSLLALYAKARERETREVFLEDPMAEEAVRRLDYDFGRLKLKRTETLAVVMRARQFDVWTAEFLAAHPGATVLHLGCGLDTRVYRVDPPPGVRWFDVDYPEIIALRRKLYPERAGYEMIGASLSTSGWLRGVPTDRPAWIVAEGVTFYLDGAEMKTLLNNVTGHLSSGEIAFDAPGKLGAKLAARQPALKRTGAIVGRWWIDDPREIKQLDPKLELVTELRGVNAYGFERLSAPLRGILRVMNLFPAMRRISRLLRYRF